MASWRISLDPLSQTTTTIAYSPDNCERYGSNTRRPRSVRSRPTRTSTPANFRFHGADGFEADYSGLANYSRSIRAAFRDRLIRRGRSVAEGNYIACQTRH